MCAHEPMTCYDMYGFFIMSWETAGRYIYEIAMTCFYVK